jgi:hypothetical protein
LWEEGSTSDDRRPAEQSYRRDVVARRPERGGRFGVTALVGRAPVDRGGKAMAPIRMNRAAARRGVAAGPLWSLRSTPVASPWPVIETRERCIWPVRTSGTTCRTGSGPGRPAVTRPSAWTSVSIWTSLRSAATTSFGCGGGSSSAPTQPRPTYYHLCMLPQPRARTGPGEASDATPLSPQPACRIAATIPVSSDGGADRLSRDGLSRAGRPRCPSSAQRSTGSVGTPDALKPSETDHLSENLVAVTRSPDGGHDIGVHPFHQRRTGSTRQVFHRLAPGGSS